MGTNCPTTADGGAVCPTFAVSNPIITSNGMNHTTAPLLTFGSADDAWGSYSYAATGQTAPTAMATSDGNGIQISGGFVAPVTSSNNYEGVGLYYNSASCLDATAYAGIAFDFSGTLGGCAIQLGASFSGDAASQGNPGRGTCAGTSSSCYGPAYDVTTQALAATPASPTVKVPFNLLERRDADLGTRSAARSSPCSGSSPRPSARPTAAAARRISPSPTCSSTKEQPEIAPRPSSAGRRS